MTTENTTLTITLTGRRPVTIAKADWPRIASAFHHDGAVLCQANRTWELVVRQHQDGRAIVYGIFTTCHQGEHARRGGELLDAASDIPAAILRVGVHLGFAVDLVDACVADLPAETL